MTLFYGISDDFGYDSANWLSHLILITYFRINIVFAFFLCAGVYRRVFSSYPPVWSSVYCVWTEQDSLIPHQEDYTLMCYAFCNHVGYLFMGMLYAHLHIDDVVLMLWVDDQSLPESWVL